MGHRQVFLRLARCNLDCAYCDTPFAPQPNCRIEDAPGSGNFTGIANPVALETIYNILYQWQQDSPGMHHSLSLTGGEPLVQVAALREWLPRLGELFPLFLETNGTLPEALAQVIDELEWISMDVKLESVCGSPTPWGRHEEFLRIARQKNCYVKAVVAEETPLEEILAAASLLRSIADEVPLILQPVTRDGDCGLSALRLLELQRAVSRIHSNVRIIPQTHRFIGLI